MKALNLFNKLKKYPVGKTIFTKLVCLKVPYFGSIKPLVVELEPNYAKVFVKKRRRVTNHLGTVHAIAMCNMAELAGGLMTDVSIPDGARWIPAGMTVEYKLKAKTDLIAHARGDGIDWTQTGRVVVPVEVLNANQQIVFTAKITMDLKQIES